MSPEQQSLLDGLSANCPDLIPLRSIAIAFREALTSHDGMMLRTWINKVKHSEFGPLVRFGYGLQKDIAAVTAAVETIGATVKSKGRLIGSRRLSVRCTVAPASIFCGPASSLTVYQVPQRIVTRRECAPKLRKSPFLLRCDIFSYRTSLSGIA